jgi:uncharacterized protein HemX
MNKWGYRKQIITTTSTGGTMQPDLLSAQREGEQIESLLPQDQTPSEPSSRPEIVQPEPTSIAETVNTKPEFPAQKKRAKFNIAVIGLTFLVFLLFLAVGWTGYWAYTLNTELTTTQGQFAALQAEHSKLQTDYTALTSENEKLNADLTQSQADLEKANIELTTAQEDLRKSKEKNEKLDAQIDTASSLTEILYVMSISDNETAILKIDRLVTETNDKELMKRWDEFTRSPSEEAMGALLEYLFVTTRNSLR